MHDIAISLPRVNFQRLRSAALLTTVLLPPASMAGVTVHEAGDTRVEIGGRIQVQYRVVDADHVPAGEEESVDDLDFRRLRPYLAFDTDAWEGIFQVDFAGGDSSIKDAYVAYNGNDWVKLTVGNQNAPFARELLTSSKRQQLVERTFAGDHDFGVPDRQMGVSLAAARKDKLQWAVGAFKAGIDPSVNKVDFVTTTHDDAEYEGNLLAARLDWYPRGVFKMAQGDFGHTEPLLVGLGINAYTWRNDDDDVVDPASDYDSIDGTGIDLALRWRGFSMDAAYQVFASETLDSGFTGGLIENGIGDFDTWAIEGGYMIIPGRLEVTAGYQALDIDALDDRDTRTSVGINYFFDAHNTKVQLTYEAGDSVFDTDGNSIRGEDQNRIFLQLQHVL